MNYNLEPAKFIHRWTTIVHGMLHVSDVTDKWAPSSGFVSSSIPSWQILTAHAQPFRGARDLAFCLKVPLDSLLLWASSEGSGETAHLRSLAWTFAARIGYKYQIRLTRSDWYHVMEVAVECNNQTRRSITFLFHLFYKIHIKTSQIINKNDVKWNVRIKIEFHFLRVSLTLHKTYCIHTLMNVRKMKLIS